MIWFDKNVYGGETFYRKGALRSGFFIVDTFLLILASISNVFVIVKLGTSFGLLDRGYLIVAFVGMWLLWGKALATHRKIRTLCNLSPGQRESGPSPEALLHITASVTHIGMFVAYLSLGLLFVEIGSLIRASH